MAQADESNHSPAAGRPEVRIGDIEREQAVTHLGRAFAEGRLELYEYDERVAAAYAAKTASDLLHLTEDLPSAVAPPSAQVHPRQARGPQKSRAEVLPAASGTDIARRNPAWLRPVWSAYVGVVGINLVIWFLVGLGNGGDFPYFWPMWVAGPWGVILLLRTLAAKSGPARS